MYTIFSLCGNCHVDICMWKFLPGFVEHTGLCRIFTCRFGRSNFHYVKKSYKEFARMAQESAFKPGLLKIGEIDFWSFFTQSMPPLVLTFGIFKSIWSHTKFWEKCKFRLFPSTFFLARMDQTLNRINKMCSNQKMSLIFSLRLANLWQHTKFR